MNIYLHISYTGPISRSMDKVNKVCDSAGGPGVTRTPSPWQVTGGAAFNACSDGVMQPQTSPGQSCQWVSMYEYYWVAVIADPSFSS
jgi:hypothetical protein